MFNEDDLIEAFNHANLPPALAGVLEEIDNMNKRELKEFSKSVIMHLAELQQKYDDLNERYQANSADYLSRCRSSGGVTLPPNM